MHEFFSYFPMISSCSRQTIYIYVIIAFLLIVPSNQQQLEQQSEPQQWQHLNDSIENIPNTRNDHSNLNIYNMARKLFLEGDTKQIDHLMIQSVPYIKTSIPMRIYECLQRELLLRCTKLFVLQKLEERKRLHRTGNLTKDFLNQFFGDEEQMGSLISDKYNNMSDKELNQRLVINFQNFFKKRDIKLHFLPGIMVDILPSKDNKLKFSLKKKTTKPSNNFSGRSSQSKKISDEMADDSSSAMDIMDSDIGGTGGTDGDLKKNKIRDKRKHKKGSSYKSTIIQMAVPVMVMPAILMGTFLPFILPMLKMATIMTMIMNNSAFIAALIYAARTHANSQEEQQHISYGHPGYH